MFVGYITSMVDNTIELSKDNKTILLQIKDKFKRQLEKSGAYDDLHVGLMCGVTYDKKFNLIKISYLKSNR